MTATAYCQRVTCEGSSGVTCTKVPDTWTDPGWWEPEECPHCHGELKDTRPDFEDIVAGLIDELHQAELLDTSVDVDERALFGAIQAELDRQALAIRRLEREQEAACPRCGGFGEVLFGSHAVGGECWNDQWTICPECNGESAKPLATSKEAAAV